VVLNVILLLSLLVSIPVRGSHPVYPAGGIAGILLGGGFSAGVGLRVVGEGRAGGGGGGCGAPLPFLEPDAVERALRGVAVRLQVLATDRRLVLRATGWGTGGWVLGAAGLGGLAG